MRKILAYLTIDDIEGGKLWRSSILLGKVVSGACQDDALTHVSSTTHLVYRHHTLVKLKVPIPA